MKSRLLVLSLLVVACGAPSPSKSGRPAWHSSFRQEQLYRPTAHTCPPNVPGIAGRRRVAAVQELPGPVNEIDPGRYTKSEFTPAVTFEVGDGWTAEQSRTGFFDIEDEPGSLDVVAVQFANLVGPETAEAAVAEIEARDGLLGDRGRADCHRRRHRPARSSSRPPTQMTPTRRSSDRS